MVATSRFIAIMPQQLIVYLIPYNFAIFSFDKGNPIIGEDLYTKLEELVDKFHRVEWRMVGGNPAERSYDKFLEVWNSSDDDCHTKCEYIINPDSELYSYGISANLYFADEKTKEWAHNNAYKYGLYFKSDDRIEPAKVVYKSYPTCKKLCEVEK